MDSFLDIINVLSDEIRLKIVILLSIRETCACNIHKILNIEQSAVSKHLFVLKSMDIVKATDRNDCLYYTLNGKLIKPDANIITWLTKYIPGDINMPINIQDIKDSLEMHSDIHT